MVSVSARRGGVAYARERGLRHDVPARYYEWLARHWTIEAARLRPMHR